MNLKITSIDKRFFSTEENLDFYDEQLLQNVSLEDKIGHLFTVDTEFTDVNPKTLLFNEIYPPIFEKKKRKKFLRIDALVRKY